MDSSLPATPVPQPTSPEQTVPQPPAPSPKKKSLGKILMLFLFVFLIIAVFLAYKTYISYNEQKTNTLIPEAKPPLLSDKIIIGTDATFRPMEYIDERGEFAGFDIDLGKRIAQELGVQPEFKHITWEKLFTALLDKKVDIILASVSITDERKKLYDFSDPYFNAGQVIITLKTNNTITTPNDLRGKLVAVSPGTTNEIEAKKYTSEKNVRYYPVIDDAFADMLSGKIHAMIQDLSGAKGLVDAHPELKIASDPFTIENYGIVFRKENKELANKVNLILKTLREKGVLDDIKQKWFE